MSKRILIVEDEIKLANLLHDYLTPEGFDCHSLQEGTTVVDWVREQQPDLILLDLMLPGQDGLSLCRQIRQFSQVPILMMTAKVEEIDRLLGLELGADDYICKPYSPREVVARVKAVLRRTQRETKQANVSDAPAIISLDNKTYQVRSPSAQLTLTALEFQLLQPMVQEPGRIFSRSQLMESMYSDHRVVSERTIDSHIKKLRKKLNDHLQTAELIHSVYGVGYKFLQPKID